MVDGRRMVESPGPEHEKPAGLDDAALLARFIVGEADAIALIAYALHRRALIAFRRDFEARHARTVSPEEEGVFLIGEVSDARIAAYRASAQMIRANEQTMTEQPAAGKFAAFPSPAKPKRRARWPWFGMWVDAPMAPNGEPEKINWKGLFLRLLVLLLAVMTTAILLRILVVKS